MLSFMGRKIQLQSNMTRRPFAGVFFPNVIVNYHYFDIKYFWSTGLMHALFIYLNMYFMKKTGSTCGFVIKSDAILLDYFVKFAETKVIFFT